MTQRKKRNSSKVNLILSILFHSSLVLAMIFFAAREGMFGKKLKEITVTMVPKEKKPEPPKEKPAQPKIEPAKAAQVARPAVTEPPRVAASAPPPAMEAPVSVAPAAVNMPGVEFSDGAHEVESVSDPNAIYKGLVELALRSRWNRPGNLPDEDYVAEVALTVRADGSVEGYRWLRGSGDARWDDSVKAALARTTAISRPPPKGFPSSFTVRFDVEGAATEGSLQLSSR
jgi:hypothetical protein